jgi:hypothetical protein
VHILKKQVSISNVITDTIRSLPNHCWWSVLKINWVYLLLALDILLMRLKDALLRHSLNPDPYTLLAAVASQYIHNVSLIITEKAITTVFHHLGSYTPTFNTHMTTQTYDSFGRNKWMFLDNHGIIDCWKISHKENKVIYSPNNRLTRFSTLSFSGS